MNAVIEHDAQRDVAERPEPLSEQTVLLQVIARAAQDPTIDLDRMERLMVMHERMVAKRAEQEFIAAMAEFKRDPPTILKTKYVGFNTRAQPGESPGRTEYLHATLGAVCSGAIEGLAKVGISHRWDLEQPDAARVRVTCVLTHSGGHSTRTVLEAGKDDSGKKNLIQQMASAVTYLQRYTLLAATGLATEDDDGAKTGGVDEEPTITEEQARKLDELLKDVKANKASFLKWARLDNLGQILAKNYDAAFKSIEAKRIK